MPKATLNNTPTRGDRLIAASPNVVRIPVKTSEAPKTKEPYQMDKIDLLRELAVTWGLPAGIVGGKPIAGGAA